MYVIQSERYILYNISLRGTNHILYCIIYVVLLLLLYLLFLFEERSQCEFIYIYIDRSEKRESIVLKTNFETE